MVKERLINSRYYEHRVNVLLIGAGGNGSELFDALLKIHQGMVALGSPGLAVSVMDDDTVSASNVVRQRFWPCEIGLNKAITLVNRGNMMMGTDWEAIPERWSDATDLRKVDWVISAVDNLATRKALASHLKNSQALWIDMGCAKAEGQVIIGRGCDRTLHDPMPNVIAHYPEILTQAEPPAEDSCSAAESLLRQDLFINEAVAQAAGNLIWQSIRAGEWVANGVSVNLKTGWSQSIQWFPPMEACA